MKIKNLETIPLAIPFNHGGKDAGFDGQNWEKLSFLLVKLEMESGIIGWGDCFSYNCMLSVKYALDTMIKPNVVGKKVLNIPGFMNEMQKILNLFGRNGILQYAFSGLDIALWDAQAKELGVPLCDALGGALRKSFVGYSSLYRYGDSEIVAEKCAQSMNNGYRSIKLHEIDPKIVKVAREICGDGFPLMVDTNCPWDFDQALEIGLAMKPYDIFWLEEPIFPPEDFASLARLQEKLGIPLAAGENACTALEFGRMIDSNAVSYVQPSVTKIGGVTEWIKTAELATKKGVNLMPHSPYFGPGFLATLQTTATIKGDSLIEWFQLDLDAYLYGEAMKPINGVFSLPTGMGLGLEPDKEVIKDYTAEIES